jgi:catechol 2,3-dioxygenase-like lactoylglutathione lyase family enzyme
MALQNLDHFNVYCADLDSSQSFYAEVLGLHAGARPDFGIPGAWLYLGGRAVVHLVGGRDGEAPLRTGPFDHIAFEAEDFQGMRTKMQSLGLDFQEADVPDFNLKQLFVRDPDGVKIELNFRG